MATKKITINELKEIVKQLIKEYNNYDYPAGADADPSAPWHQGGEPDYEGFEIINDADNIVEFTIQLHDSAGCTFETTLEDMLRDLKIPSEEYQYFDWALEQQPRPNDFMKKLDDMADKYSIYGEYICPEQDFDYDPDDY